VNHNLVAMGFFMGCLSVGNAQPSEKPHQELGGYVDLILKAFRSASPETLVVDTAKCGGARHRKYIASFDRLFFSKIFNRAKCVREISAYWSKPLPNDNFNDVTILEFSPGDLKRAATLLKNKNSRRLPIMGFGSYSWYTLGNHLILLQVFDSDRLELFEKTDALTKKYLNETPLANHSDTLRKSGTDLQTYISLVLKSIQSVHPDSLLIDTAVCKSKEHSEQLASFDWILKSKVFKLATCIQIIHAYQLRPEAHLFTSIYLMEFSPKNLTRVVARMRKEKQPVFPIVSLEYYKWFVVHDHLVFLVLDAPPPNELFRSVDTLTQNYLKAPIGPKGSVP
jgi:hypothetical protein